MTNVVLHEYNQELVEGYVGPNVLAQHAPCPHAQFLLLIFSPFGALDPSQY